LDYIHLYRQSGIAMAGQPEQQIEFSKRLDYARQLMLRLEFTPADTYQMTYQKLMDVLTKLKDVSNEHQ
jgi:hypothetical protein